MNKQDTDLRYLRMKANQAWEMAGLPREDGDQTDEQRYTREARDYERLIQEARKVA